MAEKVYFGVSNTAKEIKNINMGISSIAHNVVSGYKGVSGVARQFWSSGTPIGDLAVGNTVYMNVNGISKEFIIVHQGLPSSAYDSSCDGTWLLMKDCYCKMKYHNTSNTYNYSAVNTYLNGTLINLFDSSVKNVIKNINIPYIEDGVNENLLSVSCYLFLLSMTECGFSGDNISIKDGSRLSYFNGTGSRYIAYYEGTVSGWWTRSPMCYQYSSIGRSDVYAIGLSSLASSYYASYSANSTNIGVRPALIIPSEQPIDSSFNVIS